MTPAPDARRRQLAPASRQGREMGEPGGKQNDRRWHVYAGVAHLGNGPGGAERGHGSCGAVYVQRGTLSHRSGGSSAVHAPAGPAHARETGRRVARVRFGGSGWPGRAVFREPVQGGLLCGAVLFATASLQQIGIMTTSVGKVGFITALYIVIVPVLALFPGRRVPRLLWARIALATVGAPPAGGKNGAFSDNHLHLLWILVAR